jgi:predicted acetyltransferase
MTNITIRKMPTEDMLKILFPLTGYAFHSSPPFRDEEKWRERLLRREGVTYFALFEDEAPVGSIASTAMTQQVRGKVFGSGVIWGVVTHPAARRRGYCRRLMVQALASDREAGRPMSTLYPFRESFYERMGFVTLPLLRKAKFAPSGLAPLLNKELGGEVEMVLIGDGFDAYRDYLYRLQRRVHGMGIFDHRSKAQAQIDNGSWLAQAKVDSELVGLILYQLKGERPTKLVLTAHRFYYDSSQAKYLLLQWLARHVDQVSEIELWLPPYEQPETWLSDLKVRIETPARAAMGRVVDLAKIGGMQVGDGRFAAKVRDPLCPWNESVWQFEADGGVLRVSRAEEAACELSIQAVTSLVYGTHDPGDFAFRGWGDPSPEVEATMRAMFPPKTPYLHELF